MTDAQTEPELTMDEKLHIVGVYAALVQAMNAGTP